MSLRACSCSSLGDCRLEVGDIPYLTDPEKKATGREGEGNTPAQKETTGAWGSQGSRMLRVRVEEEVVKEEGEQRLTRLFFPELVLFVCLFFGCTGPSWLCGLFSSCCDRGRLSSVAHGLLLAGASLVAEPRGEVQGLRSHGTRAQLLHSMRDPPGSGVERVSPASQGGF